MLKAQMGKFQVCMRENANLLDHTLTWVGCSGLQEALTHHSGLSFPQGQLKFVLVQFCFPDVLVSVELKHHTHLM